MRLCDLGLEIEDSWLEGPIYRIGRELARKGLRIRPHYWLSGEWFSPEGIPGVAIPFFLAHPRLMRLEKKQMLEVEGGSRASCMRILRHEVGHTVQCAYQLHRRKRWRQHFGNSGRRYPEAYRPNPASQRFVLHLDYWYAQAHPDEDFAETFAVWLTPGSAWRRRYQGWPALRKLEYVDETMRELSGKAPRIRSRARVEPLSRLQQTLGEYYEAKHERFETLTTNIYDADLARVFDSIGAGADPKTSQPASLFLHRNRARIRRLVVRGTGRREYAVDVLLKEMIQRSRQLGLRTARDPEELLVELAILITARAVEYVYQGAEWHAL